MYLSVRKQDGLQCVLKVVNLKNMSQKEVQAAIGEIKILKSLNSPFTIRILDHYCHPNKNVNMILEFADSGDLELRIQQQRQLPLKQRQFPEARLKMWIAQLLTGLNHIHENNIIHRDIKSQNCFIFKDDRIVIGDFGVSKQSYIAESFVGSGYYLSPEIVNGSKYTKKTDIWSMGVMFYEMATLKYPFTVNEPFLPALAFKIVSGKYPPLPASVPADVRKIVECMLRIEPHERPSAKSLLGQTFVKTLSLKSQEHYKNLASATSLKKNQSVMQDRRKNDSVPLNQVRTADAVLINQAAHKKEATQYTSK